jgi:hypothetical protein
MEVLFIVSFAYLRKVRSEKIQRLAEAVASQARQAAAQARQSMPAMAK